MNEFNGIYRGKKVFLTGHTGFKGGWLSAWLSELGAEITGYSLESDQSPNLFSACYIAERLRSVIGDVRDADRLQESMKKSRPEIVFHLASQPLVRRSYREPALTFDTNVMGLVNLLEAVKNVDSVRAVVIITSDKCYENKEWVWGYRETDEMGGHDPYSASKGCAEIVASSYRRSFFMKGDRSIALATARAGNVIGGGDWSEDRLIPDCVRAFHRGEEVVLRNPSSIRPWQHVLEPLSGYLWLGAKLLKSGDEFGGGWNFGPPPEGCLEVEKVVKYAADHWGKQASYRVDNNPQVHEAGYLQLDCSKAFRLLNWHSASDSASSVASTIDWYKNYYEGAENMYDFSIIQIKKYVEAAQRLNLDWASTDTNH